MFRITKKNSLLSTSTAALEAAKLSSNESLDIFKNINFYLLPNGVGKNRLDLFKSSLTKYGASFIDDTKEFQLNLDIEKSNDSNNGNHHDPDTFDKNIKFLIIFDEITIKSWETLEKSLSKKKFYLSFKNELLKLLNKYERNKISFRAVSTLWLSECLRKKSLVNTGKYELKLTDETTNIDENKIVERPATTNKTNNTFDKLENKKILNERHCLENTNRNLATNTAVGCNLIDGTEATCSTKSTYLNKREINLKHGKDNDDSDSTDTESASTGTKKPKLLNDHQLNRNPIKSLTTAACNLNSSSEESSYDEDEHKQLKEEITENKTKKFQLDSYSWTCAHSSKEQRINHNKHITDKLEAMSAIYENTKDKYRALGYQKAILALKRCNHPITSYEEAVKIPGVGRRIADKIWEIVQTGDLRKLDELSSREDVNSIKIFTNMHGVGPSTAQAFINQGFRTLDDLRTKANLTRQQKIGLKYYYEFLERIPRDEVVQIEKIVKDSALSLNDGLIVETCGSYRRGKPTCGDVDILITHPDGHTQQRIFNKLIDLLHNKGFLTDDLVIQDETSDTQRKYLGVCRLPNENSLHRRLDIIIVPYDEYACALLYFTGSAHFNRSMRHLARKMGMSLSEHSINRNVIRKGTEKLNIGEKLVTHTEQDVFKLLNLTYRPPEERDF